jgi:peptidyl-prolyl cis-trans isomerase SurA
MAEGGLGGSLTGRRLPLSIRLGSAMRAIGAGIMVGLATAALAHGQPRLINGLAALANDAVITFYQVEQHALPAVEVFARTYVNQPEVFEQKRRETFSRALEDLVERQLIMDDFKAQGGTIPDTIVEEEIKNRIRERYGGDRATLTRTLREEGITYEMLRQRIREELVVNYMRAKQVSQAVLVSPAKIERYYATNLAQFKVPEQIKLRMIILTVPPGAAAQVLGRMREIVAKLDEGASFTEMAAVYSEGSTGRHGGDWDWTDRSTLKRGLADVAFGLKVGQHSDIVGLTPESAEGYWAYVFDRAGKVALARSYSAKGELLQEKQPDPPAALQQMPVPPEALYVMKVEDRRPARTRTLEEVRDEIEKTLIASERARLQSRWLGRLRNKAFIRYF